MAKIKKLGMSSPIAKSTRDSFINQAPDIINHINKEQGARGRPKKAIDEVAKRKTYTMYETDIQIIDSQIDRLINAGFRDKGQVGIIRMGLQALLEVSDKEFISLYKNLL